MKNRISAMQNSYLKSTLIFFLTTFFIFSPVLAESDWWGSDPWSNPERGFNWYPPDEQKQSVKKTEIEKNPFNGKNIRQITSVEALRKEVVRLRDQAILEPTEKNIYAYLDANQYVMDKSSYFADMWRRVVWQHPEIDYNVRNPQANFAQTAIKERRGLESESLIEQLSKTHGILFFFRGDCDFCHIQAPVLKMLRDRYRMEVLAVSMDSKGIKEFPNAKRDNGISMMVSQGRGIDIVPAMYLISKDKKQIVQLGAGVLAMDELVERIRVLVATKPGENF
jgi:conjugal transfer pilus assembly protein TraF